MGNASGTRKDNREAEYVVDDSGASAAEQFWLDHWKDYVDPSIKPGSTQKKSRPSITRNFKTVRVFVSSTTKDFYSEREELIKTVFPPVTEFCKARNIHLVPIDLRWGLTGGDAAENAGICMEEIKKCVDMNNSPFFINMIGGYLGSKVKDDKVAQLKQYGWVENMTITEMEILNGAYWLKNPNALFLLKNNGPLKKDIEKQNTAVIVKEKFQEEGEEKWKERMVEKMLLDVWKAQCEEKPDDDPKANREAKLKVLKGKVYSMFKGKSGDQQQILRYTCKFKEFDAKEERFIWNVEPLVLEQVKRFLEDRITEAYPLEYDEADEFETARLHHETFFNDRTTGGHRCVTREPLLRKLKERTATAGDGLPVFVCGAAGAGKTSLLAEFVRNKILDGDRVFYHFAGAVPRSTEVTFLVSRLLNFLKPDHKVGASDKPEWLCRHLLEERSTRVLIVVDALDQLIGDPELCRQLRWLPDRLAPDVRVVLGYVTADPSKHWSQRFEDLPNEASPVVVRDLSGEERDKIIYNFEKKFCKELDDNQKMKLTGGDRATIALNPLWLSVTLDILRVAGTRALIKELLATLPNTLIDLFDFWLERLEKEPFMSFGEEGGQAQFSKLLKSTLCFIGVSRAGLLEAELLPLLGDEDDADENKGRGLRGYKWAGISYQLKPFLRPVGSLDEGRVGFYHRTLQEAVHKRYLRDKKREEKLFRQKIIKYFEASKEDVQRRVEEVSHQLECLWRDKEVTEQEFAAFLSDWDVFEFLFDETHSQELLRLWNLLDDKDLLKQSYEEALGTCPNNHKEPDRKISLRHENVARFYVQAKLPHDSVDHINAAYKHIPTAEKKGDKLSWQAHTRIGRIHSLAAMAHANAGGEDCEDGLAEHEETIENHSKEAVHHHEQAVRLVMKEKEKDEVKKKAEIDLAKAKARRAYAISDFTYKTKYAKADEYREEGLDLLGQARITFRKYEEKGHLADCLMTEGALQPRTSRESVKKYEEAFAATEKIYGGNHNFCYMIRYNMGMCLLEQKDYQGALASMQQALEIHKRLYGGVGAAQGKIATITAEMQAEASQ